MNQLNKYSELLAEKGVPLIGLGLADIALDRAASLQAIEILRASSSPILGGDVFFHREGKLEPAYANWHTDKDPAESSTDYLDRSHQDSKKYIESFPHRAGITPLFVLVVPKEEVPLP